MVAQESHQHSAPQGFIRKWVFSLDHKVIGLQYYFLALTAVFVGMFLSLLMRIHLIWPTAVLPLVGEIKPETYLALVTMHGTIMVFFVLTTAPQGGFGNYFLPIQIGAEDMAFPFLNMMSFWVTFVGFVVLLLAIFVEGNVAIGAWFEARLGLRASLGPMLTHPIPRTVAGPMGWFSRRLASSRTKVSWAANVCLGVLRKIWSSWAM